MPATRHPSGMPRLQTPMPATCHAYSPPCRQVANPVLPAVRLWGSLAAGSLPRRGAGDRERASSGCWKQAGRRGSERGQAGA